MMLTKGDLMNWLVARAKEYCPQAPDSIARNRHLTGMREDETLCEDEIAAVVVDFANFCGIHQGIDLALSVKDLEESDGE